MKISDLTPAPYPQSPAVQNPNCDSYRLFTDDFNKNSFIEEHGDLEIVQNGKRRYDVPAFAKGRKSAQEYKAKVISKWGSN
tara:strand:+ start:100 stop:342 length:243 start_codon:yes stop_codon:yes gene_type:complete